MCIIKIERVIIMNLEYLRECRKKKFKSQRLASESINISFEMYRSIELGRRIGTVDTIVKICKTLDMDANILLDLKQRG
jgi:transcriptional regulator with XRE-family HTH domain